MKLGKVLLRGLAFLPACLADRVFFDQTNPDADADGKSFVFVRNGKLWVAPRGYTAPARVKLPALVQTQADGEIDEAPPS